MKKAIGLFDLDGTLADTDRDIRESWKAALADLGLNCPDLDTRFVAGPPIDEMARILFPDRYTDALAQQIRAGFARHYDHDGFPNTREYPGVRATLERLKAEGCRLFIVTNKRHAAALAMARHFGWDALFEEVLAGDMYAATSLGKLRKPALVRHLVETRGLRAEDCVLVGDTSLDFEAARANGILSVGVTWGYGKPSELDVADVRVHAPTEIITHFL